MAEEDHLLKEISELQERLRQLPKPLTGELPVQIARRLGAVADEATAVPHAFENRDALGQTLLRLLNRAGFDVYLRSTTTKRRVN